MPNYLRKLAVFDDEIDFSSLLTERSDFFIVEAWDIPDNVSDEVFIKSNNFWLYEFWAKEVNRKYNEDAYHLID